MISKNNIPSELTVKIEKLSNLGFGISHFEGYVIFVEGACPGDVVKIKLGKKNKTYANASIVEIIEPSPNRVEPFCKMQKVCGACQLQFIDYDAQLKFKKEIVQDTMHSIFGQNVEIKDVVPSPNIKEYRHKIQYPVSETKESKRILAGYYKPASHELVNIKHCPIQPSICDEIIEFIRGNAPVCKISGYDEKLHKGDLRHVVIRVSAYDNSALVTLVVSSDTAIKKAKNLAQNLYDSFDAVKGVFVNINSHRTNLIMGEKTENVCGQPFINERLTDKIFKIGPKTFFQVNPKSADNIFNYVKKYIRENYKTPTILDAYAGIAAFGICLSDTAEKVYSVEEVKESVDMAKEIIEENGIANVEVFNYDSAEFFENCIKENRKFDVVVLDPPRKGCTEESLEYALKLAQKQIIYVSCNPATLARDLKYLTENGAGVKYIQPFDMFPHTYHIENVAIIDVV